MWIVEGEAFEAISAANSDQHLRFFSLLLPSCLLVFEWNIKVRFGEQVKT